MAKLGKAKKSSFRSQKPMLSVSTFNDKDRLERKEHDFDKNYGFVKGLPPRSPVNSEWAFNDIVENRPFMDDYPGNPASNLPYLEKEQALVAGHVHGFGHRGKQIEGGLRHSGHPKAHRIGKR